MTYRNDTLKISELINLLELVHLVGGGPDVKEDDLGVSLHQPPDVKAAG